MKCSSRQDIVFTIHLEAADRFVELNSKRGIMLERDVCQDADFWMGRRVIWLID